jgi:hypothetical protein
MGMTAPMGDGLADVEVDCAEAKDAAAAMVKMV